MNPIPTTSFTRTAPLLVSLLILAGCDEYKPKPLVTEFKHELKYYQAPIVSVSTLVTDSVSESRNYYTLQSSCENIWQDDITRLVLSYDIHLADTIIRYYDISNLNDTKILIEFDSFQAISESSFDLQPIFINTSSGALHSNISNVYYGVANIYRKNGTLASSGYARGIISADGRMELFTYYTDSIYRITGQRVNNNQLQGNIYLTSKELLFTNLNPYTSTNDSLLVRFTRPNSTSLQPQDYYAVQLRLRKQYH